jgi:hypothetical protein
LLHLLAWQKGLISRVKHMHRLLLVCWLGLWAGVAHGQEKPEPTDAAQLAPKRQLQAVRISTAPKLDGLLDEAVWQSAPIASQFYELEPTPGPVEKHPTEVRVLYDDNAIYVGAIMHDVAQDSILRELSNRDEIGNSDWFGVFLDTYNDHLNGYQFILTPGGVQVDARQSPANGEDGNWNAVWDSRTALRGTDWVVEMQIPYSAIRFSSAPEQVWGLNFGRQRRSTRQKFFWNEVKPQVDGFVNQWGELTGLRDLKPPLRLSLTPYVSTYVNHYPYNEQGKQNTSTSFNGGADVKWGINESFTLDATCVPDFGQVQSDNQVLNLSPFEVQFNETAVFHRRHRAVQQGRPLLLAPGGGGAPWLWAIKEQLRAGTADTKRPPAGGEFCAQNPGITPLLMLPKNGPEPSKAWGVGVFNALSNDVYATVLDSTSGASAPRYNSALQQLQHRWCSTQSLEKQLLRQSHQHQRDAGRPYLRRQRDRRPVSLRQQGQQLRFQRPGGVLPPPRPSVLQRRGNRGARRLQVLPELRQNQRQLHLERRPRHRVAQLQPERFRLAFRQQQHLAVDKRQLQHLQTVLESEPAEYLRQHRVHAAGAADALPGPHVLRGGQHYVHEELSHHWHRPRRRALEPRFFRPAPRPARQGTTCANPPTLP